MTIYNLYQDVHILVRFGMFFLSHLFDVAEKDSSIFVSIGDQPASSRSRRIPVRTQVPDVQRGLRPREGDQELLQGRPGTQGLLQGHDQRSAPCQTLQRTPHRAKIGLISETTVTQDTHDQFQHCLLHISICFYLQLDVKNKIFKLPSFYKPDITL